MNKNFVEILRCPKTNQKLVLKEENGIKVLETSDRKFSYKILNNIPRFVPESNYADNFGLQWNYFAQTQLDSHSGTTISSDRFWKSTDWNPKDLKDKLVLDVGCGSGRFAEIALKSGAYIVALDYSSAVDACWANLKRNTRLLVVQGNIYELPFAAESFDFVYSLGVLQHTPDVEKAISALPMVLKHGGKLCVDFYQKSILSYLLPKFWLRPFTKRMKKETLFKIVKRLVNILLPISFLINKIPVFGKYIIKFIPVANYEGLYSLNKDQLYEWAFLDTYDWFSPQYDNPQTPNTIKTCLSKLGFNKIEVLKEAHLVGRGEKI